MTISDAVGEARIIVGVDTHRDEHVAVAIDQLGARLGEHRALTTSSGYEGRWEYTLPFRLLSAGASGLTSRLAVSDAEHTCDLIVPCACMISGPALN